MPYMGMVFVPEISILNGRITEIGGRYIWMEWGTRVVLLPNIDMRKLEVGMLVTVRAVRRHGQYIAESITVEQPSGGVAPA